MRTICRYRFYICVIEFSNDLFYAGILVFDIINKKRNWIQVDPLENHCVSCCDDSKKLKFFLTRLSETSVLMFTSEAQKVPKLLIQSRNISRAEEWETFILNLTVTLRN